MRGRQVFVWVIPALALLFGGAGALVYRAFLRAAIEPDTALLIPGMAQTYALIGVTTLAAAVLAVLTALSRGDYPDSYGHSFYAPHPLPLAAAVVAGGLLVAAGLVAVFGYATSAERQLSQAVLGAMMVPTGIALEEIARRNYRGEAPKGRLSGLLLLPGYSACVWLIHAYQGHTANPVVLDYVFLLLGIVSAILAFYYQAAFSFEGPRPGRAVWCAAMAVVLLLTAMGHREDAVTMCLCGGVSLYLLTQMTVLLYRGFCPARLAPLELPAEEEGPSAAKQTDKTDEMR